MISDPRHLHLIQNSGGMDNIPCPVLPSLYVKSTVNMSLSLYITSNLVLVSSDISLRRGDGDRDGDGHSVVAVKITTLLSSSFCFSSFKSNFFFSFLIQLQTTKLVSLYSEVIVQ